MKLTTRFCAPVLLAVSAGCASNGQTGSLYMHPNADLSTYQRVAVLPLQNLTIDRLAGERVRDILVVELSSQGLFDVVDVGEVTRVLRLQGLTDASGLGPEELRAIGNELGVQALFLGSVIEYRERRTGTINAPEIALSLRLIDVETGIVAWSVSDGRTGVGVTTRLFGVGEESLSEASRNLVRLLIGTMTY